MAKYFSNPPYRPDQQQARTRVVPGSIGVEGGDHVFELLVRNDAPDKHDVGPLVIEGSGERPVGLDVQMCETGNDGQNTRRSETERLELLAIEFRITERELGARDVGHQLAAAVVTELHQVVVHAEEVLRRRDVVVNEDHPARQCVCGSRRAGADREMMDEDVLGTDLADHLAVVQREIFESRIGGFDENLGGVAGGAQDALAGEYLVADRIAVAKRGEDLVHARLSGGGAHACCGTTAPAGTPASTVRAGGRSARRRASHPGIGSIPRWAGALRSCSSISRYFRSMTGQS